METQPVSSTVQAWELGARLKEYRTQLGLTATSVAKTVGIQAPNFSSFEAGKRRITATKLAEVARLYEMPEEDLAELEALREDAERRHWWHDYSELYGEEFLRLLGLEAGACEIRQYAPDIVPGLLQTSDYARAMIRAGSPYIRAVDVGPRVESRLGRQDRIESEEPLGLVVLLGEAALRYHVGGIAVMRAQIDRLLEVASERYPHVTVRVTPYAMGAHSLMGGALSILAFPSKRLPDLVWQETAIAGNLVDKRQVIRESKAGFEETFDRALDEDASREIMQQVRQEMEAT